MTESVAYVYGISTGAFPGSRAPEGLEAAPVELLVEGEVGALVSMLPAERYAGPTLEALTADVSWLGARAVEHDRVLTWASDRADGAVAPLPMFSLFRDEGSVRGMLRERHAELSRVLGRLRGGREYTVRVYRLDAVLRASLAELSPRIAELEAEAARATPGQRYLLERKTEGERRNELARAGQEGARRIFAALSAVALDAVSEPPPATASADAPGTLLATMSFLVAHESLEALRREVTRCIAELGSRGFHLDFTGPWPAYHFARDARGDD
jgi:hypothetical protein